MRLVATFCGPLVETHLRLLRMFPQVLDVIVPVSEDGIDNQNIGTNHCLRKHSGLRLR